MADIVTPDRCTPASSAQEAPTGACDAAALSPRSASVSWWAGGWVSACVIVTFKSGSTCSRSPDPSARQPGVFVHPLAGDDDAGTFGEVAGADAHRAARARVLEVAPAGRAAGVALEHEQVVHVGVPERPQVGGVDEDHVEREHREVGRDPGRGTHDRGAHVPVLFDLARDQREESLGVGLTADEPRRVAELGLDPLRLADHAVVGEQTPALLEWMRVFGADRARRCVPDVRDERTGGDFAGLLRERLVLVGGQRLLGHDGFFALEPSEAGAVGLAATLLRERVGRLEQPEGGADGLAPAAHSE